MTVQTDKILCFGFGYTAEWLSHRLVEDGWQVFGTSRNPEKTQYISALSDNHSGILFDNETNFTEMSGAHLLISIPPTESGCPAFERAKELIDTAPTITYLSTTGVYGDHGGGWVYEDTPPNPQTERAKRRVVAEQQWASVGANIARLPGIYGPGRSAFDRLRKGTARRIIKPGQVFSRCHVEDISTGLERIFSRKTRNHVLHFCDDEPAPPQDVIEFAANLLRLEVPRDVALSEAGLSDMARSFYAECKRVSNTATKDLLDWQPAYPTYREGLQAILDFESQS